MFKQSTNKYIGTCIYKYYKGKKQCIIIKVKQCGNFADYVSVEGVLRTMTVHLIQKINYILSPSASRGISIKQR